MDIIGTFLFFNGARIGNLLCSSEKMGRAALVLYGFIRESLKWLVLAIQVFATYFHPPWFSSAASKSKVPIELSRAPVLKCRMSFPLQSGLWPAPQPGYSRHLPSSSTKPRRSQETSASQFRILIMEGNREFGLKMVFLFKALLFGFHIGFQRYKGSGPFGSAWSRRSHIKIRNVWRHTALTTHAQEASRNHLPQQLWPWGKWKNTPR